MELLFLQESQEVDLNSIFTEEELKNFEGMTADEIMLEAVEEYNEIYLECAKEEFKLYQKFGEEMVMHEGVIDVVKKFIMGVINFFKKAIMFIMNIIGKIIGGILTALGNLKRKIFKNEEFLQENENQTISINKEVEDHARNGVKWGWIAETWYSAFKCWDRDYVYNTKSKDYKNFSVGNGDKTFQKIEKFTHVKETVYDDEAKEAIIRLTKDKEFYLNSIKEMERQDNNIEISKAKYSDLIDHFTKNINLDKKYYNTCKSYLSAHLKILEEIQTSINKGEEGKLSNYGILLDKAAISLINTINRSRLKAFKLFLKAA